ncbi:MAG: helicase-related protein, partial [Actinomycetaceae bacterium]|nr:helicase-related protein [Actinomycetaceae bacterium]
EIPDMGGALDVGEIPAAGSVWPHVEESVVDQVLRHRSTIVFVNSRRLAERLTSRLNEAYVRRLGYDTAQGDTSAPGPPAEVIGMSGQSAGAPPVLAKSHHGSVSKQQREVIEEELKSGRLRCVVATSSLELGIDMGAVDHVIHIESPPSVASGLQRVGRAGHHVGGTSRATLYPKHSGDVLHSAVVAERMLSGRIEALAIPRNPLDILAQQTVAECALGSVDVEHWYATVRRSAPFQTLSRGVFDTVLDFLAGRYPSDEFAELRPRLVWDREAGTIAGRPGAQRLAVTSGGTIPDRGTYGVFVAGQEQAARVGELDEEMVYESRVGDVFTLGTSSWRIVEITHDRVNVAPAFGRPGRLPFWRADGLGRPAELGQAMGRFYREISEAPKAEATTRLAAAGLDANARGNLLAYLREQRAATGTLPTDCALTVERGRDDTGDWHIILHSPYGRQVHAPLALAVSARIRAAYGSDASAVASDDGIIVRVPDTASGLPGAELFTFDPEELERIVTDEAAGSALFASRFRQCAARSLLMPRLNPARRMPLWQQRQRSAALLDVARRYPDFPVILEALREVLQDVYDLPALVRVARGIAEKRIRLVEVDPERPSPFARDLLFGYIDNFVYEGDAPLAERRTALLQVDPELLGDLLGRVEMRDLLDAEVIAEYEAQMQRLAPGWRVRGVEGVADLLRQLGPLSVEEVAARLEGDPDGPAHAGRAGEGRPPVVGREAPEDGARLGGGPAGGSALPDAGQVAAGTRVGGNPKAEDAGEPASPDGAGDRAASAAYARACLDSLVDAHRAIRVPIASSRDVRAERYAAIEDAARLRDGLGVPLPRSVPEAFLMPVAHPVDDLVSRFARTHGPFTDADAAGRLGLGVAVVRDSLRRLRDGQRVTSGFFLPDRPDRHRSAGRGDDGPAASRTGADAEWCDVDVLRRLRQRTLAALRGSVEPVSPESYARFLPAWQHADGSLEGVDGLLAVVEQLAGVPMPASALESLVLPARVRDYAPAMLDQLTSCGEVTWAGCGRLPGRDGWIALFPAGYAGVALGSGVPGSGASEGPGEPGLGSKGRLGSLGAATVEEARAAGKEAGATSNGARAAGSGARAEARVEGNGTGAVGSGAETSGDQREKAVAERILGERITAALAGGGAHFGAQLREAVGGSAVDGQAFTDAIWDLVWAGRLTNDTLAPVRAYLAHGTQAHRSTRAPRSRAHRRMGGRTMGGYRAVRPSAVLSPLLAGRWSLLAQPQTYLGAEGALAVSESGEADPAPDTRGGAGAGLAGGGDAPRRGEYPLSAGQGIAGPNSAGQGAAGRDSAGSDSARGGTGPGALVSPEVLWAVEAASALLDRYGVVTRGSAWQVPGGFARMYGVLKGFEDAGHCRRGYFIEGLGAAQFAEAATVDRLRQFSDIEMRSAGSDAVVLAATDPANAYGAALPWPVIDGVQHRPGRKAGALVVLVAGRPALYVERGGRTVLQFTDDADALEAACHGLARIAVDRHLETLTIEKINGNGAVFRLPLATHLRSAGFVDSPRGLTLRRAY